MSVSKDSADHSGRNENSSRECRSTIGAATTRGLPALEAELRSNVEGEVRFDAGSKAMYAVDASNYRQVPIGVVVPKTKEDVVQTVAACRKFGAPVLSRGGGTSLAGQCCNVAVVIDWSKYMHGVLEVNTARALGARLAGDGLRRAAQSRAEARATTSDLGSGSGHPRPLLLRRHDRQQLLRRPRADGGQDATTTSKSWRCCSTTARA